MAGREAAECDAPNRLNNVDRADDFDQSWTLDGLGDFVAFDDDKRDSGIV